MALTLKADGLNPENLFTAAWVNDFTNLLTGVMKNQPVTLDYRPGSGSTPTLTLKTDGRPLIRGFKSDNTTQAFQVDQNGNLSIAGNATITGTLTSGALTVNGDINMFSGVVTQVANNVPGSTTSYVLVKVNGNSNGRVAFGIRSDGSGVLRMGNDGSAYQSELYTDGTNLIANTPLKVKGSKFVLYAETGLSGKFSAQSTAPSSPADGDLWLDLSTVLS